MNSFNFFSSFLPSSPTRFHTVGLRRHGMRAAAAANVCKTKVEGDDDDDDDDEESEFKSCQNCSKFLHTQ
jgi:hypothetical protein